MSKKPDLRAYLPVQKPSSVPRSLKKRDTDARDVPSSTRPTKKTRPGLEQPPSDSQPPVDKPAPPTTAEPPSNLSDDTNNRSSSATSTTSTAKRIRSGKSILDDYVKRTPRSKPIVVTTKSDPMITASDQAPATPKKSIEHTDNHKQENPLSETSAYIENEAKNNGPENAYPTPTPKRESRAAARAALANIPMSPRRTKKTWPVSPPSSPSVRAAASLSSSSPPPAEIPAHQKYAHLLQKKLGADGNSPPPAHRPPSAYGSPFTPSTATFAQAPLEDPDAIPAFLKYASIFNQGLPLPDKYEVLAKISHALDHALVFMKGQNQQCVFHKVKKPVENMSRRTFEMRHLAQIKTIAPNAYTFEAVQVQYQNKRVDSVTIEFGSLATDDAASGTSMGRDDDVGSTPVTSSTKDRALKPLANQEPLLSSAQLDRRRETIRSLLFDLVNDEHEKFLANLLVRPEPTTPDAPLRHWHPRFDLDTVPDVAEAPLPQVARNVVNPAALLKSSGNALPAKVHGTLAKVAANLEASKAAKKNPAESVRKEGSSSPKPADKPATTASKASALLERIRAKEKKKAEETMYGDSPEKIRRRTMMSRLPDIVDLISFVFTSSKKNVMFLRELSRKITESYKTPLSEAEAEDHIRLLAEVAPDWCRLSSVDNGTLLKIERHKALREVKNGILNALAKM